MLRIKSKQIKSNIKAPFCLIVLDGWGIAPSWGGNAISLSKTPIFDGLWRTYPSTKLLASGVSVGLPEKAPGNSEAGHLNIGAGRIVHQDITVIDRKIESGELKTNSVINAAIAQVKSYSSNLHLIGLLSDVGTHSHLRHLYSLLSVIKDKNFDRVFIHLISDGRDSDPMDGIVKIGQVEAEIAKIGLGKIASISGRFYAMDRDNRWGRTARAYNALTKGEARQADNSKEIFSKSYSFGTNDEFIEPTIIFNKFTHFQPIKDNDAVIVFNFRFDRIKQLLDCFGPKPILDFPDRKILSNIYLASFANGTNGTKFNQVFALDKIACPLAKVFADNNLTQLHIAETEKFPHITYFINGGVDVPYPGESRIHIPSPHVKTYDLQPKMSAELVAKAVITEIRKGSFDVIMINFANPDMVGHTGNLKATTQAIRTVDQYLGQIVLEVQSLGGTIVVCADHGNAEQMVNPATGDADTEHTTNPVPFILVNDALRDKIRLKDAGSLSNIAPTILEIMKLPTPTEMNARESLIVNNLTKEDANA